MSKFNLSISFVLVFALGVGVSIATPIPRSEKDSGNMNRACTPAGAWTNIACTTGSAASSAQIARDSRFLVSCTKAAYLRIGTAATGQDASSTTAAALPALGWLDFVTDGENRYISCLNVDTDSGCKYVECK